MSEGSAVTNIESPDRVIIGMFNSLKIIFKISIKKVEIILYYH